MAKKIKESIVIGKTPSQMPGSRWYERKGNIMELEPLLKHLPKQRVISYLKVVKGVRGGSRQTLVQYWKTLENGYMIYVDIMNMKIGIVQGLSSNYGISGSTKKEFDTHFNKLLKILQV